MVENRQRRYNGIVENPFNFDAKQYERVLASFAKVRVVRVKKTGLRILLFSDTTRMDNDLSDDAVEMIRGNNKYITPAQE